MTYYVIIAGWSGYTAEEMQNIINNNAGRNAIFFECGSMEEAEEEYNYHVENDCSTEDNCYIFDGNEIVRSWQ